jgi:predicted nucleic acid-binding protein
MLDTNIVVRYARKSDPDFAVVDTAIHYLHRNVEILCVVPQNVYEFWAVATRPTAAKGLGLTVKECQTQFARIKRLFLLLPDPPALFGEWEALVGAHSCHGRVSFDARLVAAMRVHDLTGLLTFNGAHCRWVVRLPVARPKGGPTAYRQM